MPRQLPLREIRAVFFDADDTIFELNGTLGEIYSGVCQSNGYQVEAGELDKRALSVWKSFRPEYRNESNGFRTSPVRERDCWYKFIKLLLEDATGNSPSKELVQLIYDEFSYPRSRRLRPAILDLVTLLKGCGYFVGVLSNNDDRIVRLLERWSLSQHFEQILPAADLGFKKPATECFDKVATQLEIPPAEMLYIGDNLELDYLAPRSAGWHAIWYNQRAISSEEEVIQVKCHSDLVKIFQNLP